MTDCTDIDAPNRTDGAHRIVAAACGRSHYGCAAAAYPQRYFEERCRGMNVQRSDENRIDTVQ